MSGGARAVATAVALGVGVGALSISLYAAAREYLGRKKQAQENAAGGAGSAGGAAAAAPAPAPARFTGRNAFEAAVAYTRDHGRSLNTMVKLKLYGLYKQATYGSCTEPAPSRLDVAAHAKHEAWCAAAGLSRERASEAYIALVTTHFPDWRESVTIDAAAPAPPTSTAAAAAAATPADAEEAELYTEEEMRANKSSNSGGGGGDRAGIGYSSRPLAPTGPAASELNVDPLYLASQGDVTGLRALLASGGKEAVVAARNDSGETPLHAAADAGQLEVVQLLLSAGCDPCVAEAEVQQTPLHYACAQEHAEVAAALIKAGAALDVQDADGAKPLSPAGEDFKAALAVLLPPGTSLEA